MTRRFDDMRHAGPPEPNWIDALLAGLAVLIGAAVFLATVMFWMGVRPAHARWSGAYVLNDDGSVTIEHEGLTHKLPAYMVLKGGNPIGHAVWWFTDAGGVHRDYCFARGR